MKSIKLAFIGVVLLALAACTPTQGIGAASFRLQTDAEFNTYFLEDVQQAKVMATLTNDRLAVHCWTYLETFAEENAPDPTVETGNIVGALSAYQAARNVRRAIIEVKLSDDFRFECGPMLMDSRSALGRLRLILPVPVL